MFRKSHFTVLAALAAVAGLSIMSVGNASANMIQNGDFSANASSYTINPGYSDYNTTQWAPNPAAPTNWTINSANVGINGSATGFGNDFGPTSLTGVTDFAFIQTEGNYASQSVATTVGQTYTLTYDGSGRAGDNAGSDVLEVILTDTTNNTQITTQTPAIAQTAFNAFALTFTAPSASTNVEFLNNSPGSAGLNGTPTVDVSNVAMSAVPEPASVGLLGVGAMGLLLLKRRRTS